MRRFCLFLLAVSMMVTACKSRSQDRRGSPEGSRPVADAKGGNFWDDNPSPSPKSASAPIDPRFGLPNPNESELDGVLAGRVVDNFDRPPGNVFIRVTLIDPSKPDAPPKEVGVTPNSDGYFVIQGLKPRQTYNLVAQAKDGERTMAGVVQARPPYTRILIRVSEDKRSSVADGPIPSPVGTDNPFSPPPPAKSPNADAKSAPPPPPASIPRPAPNSPPEPDPIPMGGGNPEPLSEAPRRANPSSPANAVPRDANDGSWSPGPRGPAPIEDDLPPSRTPASEPMRFESIADGPARARDPNLNIPNPKRPPPRAEPPSRYSPPSEDQSLQIPSREPPPRAPSPNEVQTVSGTEYVPARVMSRTLQFTVYDPQGQPWNFEDHSGRLVLLDFWSTTCRPCLASMPEIKRLTSRYGAAGLEVIGIAIEDGPWGQRAAKVAEVARMKQLNYRVYLENGPQGSSGVQRMFRVNAVPTLILLNADGKELWRGTGGQIGELESMLQRMLIDRR